MSLKKLMTILLSTGFALPVFCQQRKLINENVVKGIVIDTGINHRLQDATVVIVNGKDSIIRQFTRSLADGTFLMKGLQNGSYLLHISYPGYADYTEKFALDSSRSSKDFGSIGLVLKVNLLKEVVIRGAISTIRIKGDTTEYNASAYNLSSNARVEDLLKRLPGIQIDKDGKISAQGRMINKVLVDGEEFFGDDPTLVTRNLRADMVEKVQLFDKKSDLATLTGVDDGKTDKTLNIKLKEDKKNGYFGKADAGLGTGGYYRGQILFNAFKGKQKFSVYGITGNEGKTSLDWQDNAKYATSNIDISTPGIMIDLGGYDELESHSGRYDGKGLPTARTGGLHYDNKWRGDMLSVNANYKIGALTINGDEYAQSQNNLPTGRQKSNTDQSFHNNIFRQKIDGVVEFKPDSNSSLKLTFNGGIKKNTQVNGILSTTKNETGEVINDNVLENSSNIDQQNMLAGLLFTKKLKKPGRTLSLNLIGSISKANASELLNSKINLFSNGSIDSTQKVNQSKTNRSYNNDINTSVNYSEPLSKSMLMVLSYGFAAGTGKSNRSTFNQTGNGYYGALDSLYSNNFKVKQLSNRFGLNFNLAKNRTILAFGSKVSTVDFRQFDLYSKNRLDRTFLLWNPQLNLNYRISQQYSLRLNYEGNSTEPTVAQLQPVLINTDPLNIIQGNPSLRPSFVHRMFVGYQGYNPLNGQLVGIFSGYQLTSNPVVSNLITDSLGRTVNQYINMDNRNIVSYNFAAFFDRKIKALDLNAGINLNVNGNTYYNLSNNTLNRTNYTIYTLQARFSKSKINLYEFNASLGPTYTRSGSSLQQDLNNNGNGFAGNGDITVYLPARFQVAVNANYQYNSKTGTFDQDFSRLIINASLNKLFLNDQSLKLSLSGNDLLNQNTGFNRNVSGNLITQNNYTTIRRYFMIALSYDFNKVGQKTDK